MLPFKQQIRPIPYSFVDSVLPLHDLVYFFFCLIIHESYPLLNSTSNVLLSYSMRDSVLSTGYVFLFPPEATFSSLSRNFPTLDYHILVNFSHCTGCLSDKVPFILS